MSGPPADLLKEMQEETRRRQMLEASNQSWKLCDVVRVNKTQVVGVIAKLVNGVPYFHDAPPFRTEREAREFVAAHNDRIEQTRTRKPLPERPPAVINFNGTIVKTRTAAKIDAARSDNEDGWFDETRDYKKNPPHKPINEDFEIHKGKDGLTVRRWKDKKR